MSAQSAAGGEQSVNGLSVGQKVRVHTQRWTPDGWEPVVELATVVDPCVQNDPVFAGDVEIKIEGVLNRVFKQRSSLEPVEQTTLMPQSHVADNDDPCDDWSGMVFHSNAVDMWLQARCDVGDTAAEANQSALYRDFAAWLVTSGADTPFWARWSAYRFARELASRGYAAHKRGTGIKVRRGIALKPAAQAVLS